MTYRGQWRLLSSRRHKSESTLENREKLAANRHQAARRPPPPKLMKRFHARLPHYYSAQTTSNFSKFRPNNPIKCVGTTTNFSKSRPNNPTKHTQIHPETPPGAENFALSKNFSYKI